MPKEKSVNPAAAQRKADKQKEIAKSKKQQQAQRNEKLARRNPERLQKQIDELKELEARGTPLRPKDQETLKLLERDLKGVRRAREALGEAAPKFRERRDDAGVPGGRGGDARREQMQRRQGHQQQHLGKRRRDEDDAESDGEASDAEVRDIPMPKDTPPPIPHTARREASRRGGQEGRREPHALPAKPVLPPAQTVYSSAPQIKDLKKEAARFVPAAVAAQKRRMKGEGRLLEPEEADRLEQAGYVAAKKAADEAEKEAKLMEGSQDVGRRSERELEEEARRLEEELNSAFPQEEEVGPRPVQMEEVEDEGD